AGGERSRRSALGPQAQGPEQRASLVRALTVDEVRLGVAGLVVDRRQEQRGIRVRDLLERRRLVVLCQLLDPRGDALGCLGIRSKFRGGLRGPGYHQTVDSMSSPSPIGLVWPPEDRYFQPSSGTRKPTLPSSSPPAIRCATYGTAPAETPANIPSTCS